MASPGPDPDITLEATLATVTGRERPGDPVTATEVAEALGCTRRTAHRKLEQLAERGEIETKKVGARSRVWWRPPVQADGGPVDGSQTTQFEEFVRSVEDYAIFTLDAEGDVDSWNEGAAKIKGYDEAAILGEHFSTFYTDAAVAAGVPERNLERAREHGRCEDEGWRVRRDGSEFYANVVITAIRDDDGGLRGFTKVTRDLTERRRTTQERELNLAVNRSIAEARSVDDGLRAVLGDVCAWTDWSVGLAWLSGAGAPPQLSATYVAPEADVEVRESSAVEGPESIGELPRRVFESAEPVWLPDVGSGAVDVGDHPMLSSSAAVRAALGIPVIVDGEVSAVLEFYMAERRERDDRFVEVVTAVAAELGGLIARRRAEDRAERERRLVEQLFEAVPAVVAVVEADGTIVRTNEEFRDLFDIESPERDLDIDTPEIHDERGEPVPPAERPTRRVLADGEPVQGEVLRFGMPGEDDRWLSVNAVPIHDDAGAVEYAVVAASDVTDLRESERALARRTGELEAELEEIFGRSSEAFVALDEEWRVTYVNEQARSVLRDAAPEEALSALEGRDLWELVPSLRDGPFESHYREAMATQEAQLFEAYLPALETWYEMRAYPSETGLSVYFRDVTDRVRRQRELERYEHIFETVQDGVYTVDADGRFTMVNEAYCGMTGRSREELIGAHVSEVVDEETIEAARGYERELIEGDRETAKVEADLWTADGDTIRAEATFAMLPGDDEDHQRVGVVRDVSERVARERELEQYETVFENVRDGVYITDEERRLALVNDAYCELTGLDREAVVGEPISSVVGADAAARTGSVIDEMVAGERPIEPLSGNHNAPDDRHLESWFVLLPLEDGEFAGTTGVIRDVTDRERREERLRALNDSARSFLRDETVEEIGRTCTEAAEEILDVPGVGFYHHDREQGLLVPSVVSTEAEFMHRELPAVPPDDSSLTGHVFAEGKTRRFDDVLAEESTRVGADETEMRSGVFSPIGEYGILICGAREEAAFDEETERLVELLTATAEAAFERIERQREVEESERRYRALAEHFPNGAVALFDRDLRMDLVAGGIFDRIDLEPSAIEGRTISELTDIGLGPEFAPTLRETLDGGHTHYQVDVGEIIFDVNNVPIEDEDEGILYGLSMAQDVTDRVRRERELERYETIVETVQDGIYVVDEDYEFVLVNDAYTDLVGRSREELIGAHISTVVDEELVETGTRLREQLLDDAAAGGTVEVDLETAEGEQLTAEVNYGLLPGDADSFSGTVGVIRDVTERKEREQELEEYERIVETVDDGVYVLDTEERFQRVNEAFARMTSFERAELLGMHASTVFGEKFDEREAHAVEQLTDDAAVATLEEEIFPAAGEPITVENRFRRFDLESGRGRVGVVRDITERKERERELQRALELLEQAERVADVGGWEIDATTEEVFWTDHLFELLGRDPETSTEPDLDAALDVYHPEDRPTVEAAVEAAMTEGGSFDVEARFHRDDGALRWFRLIGVAESVAGEVRRLRGAVQDVTRRKEREQALERYKTVFDTVDDGIYILGPDFHFEEVNDAYVEMTGYDRAELIGAHCSLAVGEETAEENEEMVRAIATEGRGASTLEADIITEAGEHLPAESKFTPLPSEDGFVGSVGVVRDLSDRRAYERELRRYETLIEESTDVNAIIDTGGEIQYATPSATYVLGHDPEALVGQSAFDYVHEDDRRSVVETLESLADDRAVAETSEFRFRHADGSWVWLEARGRNLTDDPTIDGLVVYSRDVTDRKEYELELQRRNRQQEAIADLGRTALENQDLDELFAEATRRVAAVLDTDYCKVLDLDDEQGELLLRQGVGWRDGIVGHATVDANENSQAGFTLEAQEPVVVEDLAEEDRFAGPELLTAHDVRSGISTIIGPPDDPWGILGAHATDRREFSGEDVNLVQTVANTLSEAIRRASYQEELEDLVERLEESNERLEQFAHIASHDLQEPLRMVSGYLQLIEDRYADELDDDGEEFIEFAVDGADRMREMINGLLSYSRVGTRGEPFERTDPAEAAEQARRNLAVQIEEAGASIEVGELPTVEADPNQLEQVFQNLISNAIKYRGDEPPVVDIHGVDRGGTEVTITVADNGIGMTEAHTDQIFDVFERLHTQEEYGGTGIGLALCKKIVERHGGDIWVESTPGEGSTFYFTLPAAGRGGGPEAVDA